MPGRELIQSGIQRPGKTKAAEAEACIEEWGEMLKVAYEKYENDEVKMKEFIEGGDSFKCE